MLTANHRMPQTWRKLKGVMILCSVFTLSGCSLLPREEQTLAPPLVEPAKVQYKTVKVKRDSVIKRVKGTAEFAAVDKKELSFSESGGRIGTIFIKNGDKVDKGEVLLQLTTGDLPFQIEQTKIKLEKASLNIEHLKEQGADDYTIKMAGFDQKAAQLQLDDLQSKLNRTRITSPIDGIVTHLTDKEQGDSVEAYESLVQVVDPNKLQLMYSASNGGRIVDVDLGMKASVEVKGKTLKGKVVQTPRDVPANLPKEMAELFKRSVIIDVQHLPKGVKLGDSADVEIVTKKKKNALTIPRSALRSFATRQYVQILDGESKKEVDVEVGMTGETNVGILKGVKEGQKVILK